MNRKSLLALLGIVVGVVVLGRQPATQSLGAEQPGAELRPPRETIQIGQRLLPHSLQAQGQVGVFNGMVTLNVERLSLIDLSQSTLSLAPGSARFDEKMKALQEQIEAQASATMSISLQAARQTEILERQMEILRQQSSMLATMVRFDKEFVTRREHYGFPNDHLTVVTADFSSGSPAEGREIADEIAWSLRDLVKATGIAINILHGEIRSGVTIRSEQMALDVGKSLSPGSQYVVIWGTMSPRTVGKYRANLTCARSAATDPKTPQAEFGIGRTVELALESEDLPLATEPQERARESYRRLIGVACAAVPSIYAAHAINREREPDLQRYYQYVGEKESKEMKAEVEALTPWIKLKRRWVPQPRVKKVPADSESLFRRLSSVDAGAPYPRLILNTKDTSCLALLVDTNGNPRVFPDPDNAAAGNVLVYVDVLEISNRQFAEFLSSMEDLGGQKQNRVDFGVPWLAADCPDIPLPADGQEFTVAPGRNDFPVHSMSWPAAMAYCKWANKSLPTRQEWLAAAEPEDPNRPAPWDGPTLNRCGGNEKDRTRVGCFDMHGSLSEWGYERYEHKSDLPHNLRWVFGERYNLPPAEFRDGQNRLRSQYLEEVSHSHAVGFRGVVRFRAGGR